MRLALQNSIPARLKGGVGGGSSKINFAGVTTIIARGDSYTDPGAAASPSSNSWINLVITATGKILINQAATGRGIAYALERTFNAGDVIESNEGVIVFAGFNDIRFTGATTERINQIKQVIRSIIASQFCSSQSIPAGNASSFSNIALFNLDITSTGYNGKANSFAVASKRMLGTDYGQDAVPGLNFTWNFTGDTLIIGYAGYDTDAPEYALGTFDVLVDGVSKGTLDPAGQTEGIPNPGFEMEQRTQPACAIYSGLGPGAHVLRINPNQHGIPKRWDWLGTLRPAADCAPILILSPSYQPDYSVGAPFTNGSDAAMDAARNAMQEVVNEFLAIDPLYPVALVDVTEGLDKNTMFDPDDIHWNNAGHAHGAQKTLAKMTY